MDSFGGRRPSPRTSPRLQPSAPTIDVIAPPDDTPPPSYHEVMTSGKYVIFDGTTPTNPVPVASAPRPPSPPRTDDSTDAAMSRMSLSRDTTPEDSEDAPDWLKATFGKYGRELGEMSSPEDVAICPVTGNIYVTEMGNNRVQVWSRDCQTALRIIGTDVNGEQILKYPCGVAVDMFGSIYVSDTGHNRVCVFDNAGKLIRWFGRKGSGPGEFNNPYGLAIAHGLVHVCDGDNHRVQVHRYDGAFHNYFSTRVTSSFTASPRRVACRKNGDVFVTNWSSEVLVFSSRGMFLAIFRPDGVSEACGLAIRPDDSLVITDKKQNKVLITSSSGVITSFGSWGGGPRQFISPRGLALTADGRQLFVVDTGNVRVKVVLLDQLTCSV